MRRHALAALCLFLAAGCEDPSGARELTGTEGELVATFGGGKRFSVRGECRPDPSPVCASATVYHHPDFGRSVGVAGIVVSGNRYEQLILSLSDSEVGTYTFGQGCERCVFVSYSAGEWPGASTLYPPPPNIWDNVSATVTITDAVNGRLRGTFSTRLEGRELPDLEVREGRFDVPLRTP
ncbi:MAG TPA: hypothetical protein VF647_03085 [Longimicrobium sp.]